MFTARRQEKRSKKRPQHNTAAELKPVSQLQFDYDTTTTKNWRSFFAHVESRRMEAGACDTLYSDRIRIIVESQL